LSLLEQRPIKSNPIIKKIARTLTVELLEAHLIKIYKKFTKLYEDTYPTESLDHINADPKIML